ncbi:MAG: tetratricopeptide repeat protein [Magnetococcales bacterium]|nr:tetratricopeptide repeat protein [Magnetococcales bacterium]
MNRKPRRTQRTGVSSSPSGSSAELSRRAEAAIAAGDPARAEALYRELLRQRPDDGNALNNLGFLVRNRGGHAEAIPLFGRALAAGASQPAVTRNNLGISLAALGRRVEAEQQFRQAIALRPGYPAPHNNLGNLLRDAHRTEEALAAFDRVLALDPTFTAAHNNRGEALRELQRHPDALAAFDRALALDPHNAAIHSNRGRLLQEMGRLDLALAAQDRALALDPTLATAHNNRGLVLDRLGHPAAALAAFDRAVALDPTLATAHNNRGEVLRKAGRIPEALAAYRQALAVRPDYAEALNNMGVAHQKGGDLTTAATLLEQAVGLNPDAADVVSNLGNVLMDLDRPGEALAAHLRAVALDPDRATVFSNLGKTFHDLGQFDQALHQYDQAIALDPQAARAHLNRAHLLLLLGRFADGWTEHEWRWQEDQSHPFRRGFSQPQWDGGPLAGRSILLHAEQGLGDTLQMVRFLPWVASRGGRVILECQPLLKSLLERLHNMKSLIVKGDPLPPFDTHMPLLGLPRVYGLTADNIPLAAGYLPPPPPPGPLEEPLPPATGPRVGLVWRGNPDHLNDRNRSIDPARLARLWQELPHIQWVSLQVGPGADGLDRVSGGERVRRVALPGFTATARWLMALDLVISVDTSVAHLAGALGRPVWTLITRVPDWRWGLTGETTPWYRSMRLLRQTERGDWDGVLERVTAELARLFPAPREKTDECA